jgi:menaquinone-dependent protoporphyrinogen oxidase
MRVLVVYGSERGGTRGIARSVRTNLIQAGHTAEVQPATAVETIDGFDAVVVGGGLYGGRWQRDARRFVERHADQLRTLPVFFFSSGPLDNSAIRRVIPPTPSVRRLMKLVGAEGHMTFGGKLAPHAVGFMAKQLLKRGMVGDFRDIRHIDEWSARVAKALHSSVPRETTLARWTVRRRLQQAAVGLCLFTGITAALGGLELVVWSQGGSWLPPISLLAHTPFDNFLVPGLLLLVGVGLSNLVAGWWMLRRHRLEQMAVIAAGALSTGWIATEMLLLRMAHWVQLTYLVIGLVTLAVGLWLEVESSRREYIARRTEQRASAH